MEWLWVSRFDSAASCVLGEAGCVAAGVDSSGRAGVESVVVPLGGRVLVPDIVRERPCLGVG